MAAIEKSAGKTDVGAGGGEAVVPSEGELVADPEADGLPDCEATGDVGEGFPPGFPKAKMATVISAPTPKIIKRKRKNLAVILFFLLLGRMDLGLKLLVL